VTGHASATGERTWYVRARLLTIVAVVLGGLAMHATYAGSGDEPHYLVIAHSLAFDFDLDLSNNYGSNEPLIAGGGLRPENHAVPDTRGTLRPIHDIGLPLLASPYVRVVAPAVSWAAPRLPSSVTQRLHLTPSTLYRNLIGIAMIAVACLLAAVLFDVLISAGETPRAAFWTTILVVLSPPLMIFSILFFTELPSALLALLVFRRAAVARDDGSLLAWLSAGAAAGFMLLVHVRNVAIVAVLATLAFHRLLRSGGRRSIVAFAGGLSVVAAVRLLVNHHLWGAWLTNPHARAGEWRGLPALLATSGNRLAGMLLDQEYGILPYAPVFLLAAVGLVRLFRTRRALAWQITVVTAAYVVALMLPITNVHGWTGGWSPAARFLVPVLPLIALAIPAGFQVVPRSVVILILTLQIAIDGYFWQHPKNLWNDGDGVAAVCARGGAPFCRFLPSFVGRE
jgi:hypothetical protein